MKINLKDLKSYAQYSSYTHTSKNINPKRKKEGMKELEINLEELGKQRIVGEHR